MTERFANAEAVMRRALELAVRGVGRVEPNPPVGAVLVDDELRLLGEGWHEWFGGPHAEVNALRAAGERTRGATLFCTLEPCCHYGKTGPCTGAVIDAGIRRTVVALRDPAPHASGKGIATLQAAGIAVDVGLLADDAARLTAPFLKRTTTGLPWVHAKWAMTLDGKIASRTGASRWISGEESRAAVHGLRGRMDAIIVGAGTVRADDPLLTARPPGPRVAARVVVDAAAGLPLESQLVRTAGEAPVVVAALSDADPGRIDRLTRAGIEVLRLPSQSAAVQSTGSSQAAVDVESLLKELGRRQMSNVLVEGGGTLLGSLFDGRLVDEVHVIIAPKIVGGAAAVTPVAGRGLERIPEMGQLDRPRIESLGADLYVHGPLAGRIPGM